jgi:flagellar protein FliL
MANETNASEPSSAVTKPTKKSRKMPLVLGILIFLAAGGAGGTWYFRHAKAHASEPPKTNPGPVAILHLESFIVNLADSDQVGYLRISMDLGLGKPLPEAKKDGEGGVPTAQIRDAIIGVLSTRKSSDLLTPEGKAKLKQDLLVALQQHVPQIDAKDIYFTDFLVQR